jgi:hypothetical protein
MPTNNATNYSPTQYQLVAGSTSGTIGTISNSTAGYVMVSNGAAANPSFQGLVYMSTKLTVTSQQIKSLLASPITVVAAQGAGTIVIPISISAKYYYAGSSVFTNTSVIKLYFNSVGGTTAASFIADNLGATSNEICAGVGSFGYQGGFADGVLDNVPLVLSHEGGTEITGNAENDNYIVIYMLYTVMKID